MQVFPAFRTSLWKANSPWATRELCWSSSSAADSKPLTRSSYSCSGRDFTMEIVDAEFSLLRYFGTHFYPTHREVSTAVGTTDFLTCLHTANLY